MPGATFVNNGNCPCKKCDTDYYTTSKGECLKNTIIKNCKTWDSEGKCTECNN